MLTLDQIRTQLKDRRITMIAKATGLHQNTIINIRDGRNQNPTYHVIKKLSEYLGK